MKKLLGARSFVRFALVGALNTALGLSAFPILYVFAPQAGVNPLLFASYVICTIFAFSMHTLVTFKSEGHLLKKAAKFALLAGCNYVVNAMLLNAFLHLFPMNPIIPQSVIAVSLQIANYWIMNRVIFVNPNEDTD